MGNMRLSESQIYRRPKAIVRPIFTGVPFVSSNCPTCFSISPLVSASSKAMNLADAFAFAYVEDHRKLGWKCRSTGGPRKISYGKNDHGKKRLICSNHLITQEKSIMENPGPLQELWKKEG